MIIIIMIIRSMSEWCGSFTHNVWFVSSVFRVFHNEQARYRQLPQIESDGTACTP